ncbi:MAG: PEGA domain-containing protein [Bacteroidales bacterium]|nr:PEGA domain-containing protein [Bacteroidales bacterium]
MKQIYTIFFILFLSLESSAQTFRVLSFEEDLSDLSAIKYERKDVNDQKCAIIKIYTNLNNLFFETRLGIEGDIVTKTGEFWVYVSQKEKMLKIIKNGYIPLEYIIPINIESSKVYKLTLTGGSNGNPAATEDVKTEFVVFETSPTGASVYINDKLKGISPLTVPLQEGDYLCKIELPLHKDIEFELNVSAGNTINVHKTLEELDIYGKINIVTTDFAEIFIDNQKIGTGKYSGKIIEGVHIIEIRADNYKTFTKEILIVANRDYNIERYLEAKLGTISVQSFPAGASILIDGEYVGTTPRFVRDVPVGMRKISLEKEGYVSETKLVEVIYDKTAEYSFDLKQGRKLTIITEPADAELYVNNVLLGTTPHEFSLDYSKHNKIKICKTGYQTVYDELPEGSMLKEKTYKLEKQTPININKTISTKKDNKLKNTNYIDKRTILGWSLSGVSSKPGGISSSIYCNLGNRSQYGAFFEAGYQFSNYNNSYLNGMINFPRFDFGISYNIWLRSFAVIEVFGSYGREYATNIKWTSFTVWEYPDDMVYTRYMKIGARLGIRISPHAELFGAYNINMTDGPAFDIWNNQVNINGMSFNYQDFFSNRNNSNWELGIRFVLY